MAMDTYGLNQTCRFCAAPLEITMIELGNAPLANGYLNNQSAIQDEKIYPLNVKVCEQCFLAQLGYFVSPDDIFQEYAYLSSCASSWLAHAKNYVSEMENRFRFNTPAFAVEIGSNDGYLLQFFSKQRWQVMGIEPAKNIAKIAENKGIPTKNSFFNQETAEQLIHEYRQADLIIANNVMAHVPNINEFVGALKLLLSNDGLMTIEIPHLLTLLKYREFDTIYHEHYYYFSLLALENIFRAHALKIMDIDTLNVHGGSLRLYVSHQENTPYRSSRVIDILQEEIDYGLHQKQAYESFDIKAQRVRQDLFSLLKEKKEHGKTIACYGAPAKGNTLLSYCGLTKKIIDFTVDKNPIKQNCLLPGSHIPIFEVSKMKELKPDYVLILPWNLTDEIMDEVGYIKEWGGQFVTPIPEVRIL